MKSIDFVPVTLLASGMGYLYTREHLWHRHL
jgi:hypothetical protein